MPKQEHPGYGFLIIVPGCSYSQSLKPGGLKTNIIYFPSFQVLRRYSPLTFFYSFIPVALQDLHFTHEFPLAGVTVLLPDLRARPVPLHHDELPGEIQHDALCVTSL